MPSLSRTLIRKIIEFPRPISLYILSVLTPKEHEVTIVEGEPDEIDYDIDADLVGISFTTRLAPLAYQIADRFRERGVKVVAGGWHPSAMPEEALRHADSVVIGEAEYIWRDLLKDMERGRPKKIYMQDRPTDPHDIPSLIPVFESLKFPIGIQATRACPYGCEFCAITHMIHRKVFRTRAVKDVVDEIEKLPQKVFIFLDNSLTISPDYTKELFREIIRRGIDKKFTAFGNIDVLGKDTEFLSLACDAGCVAWLVGFESVSQKSLDWVKKKTNVVKDYKSAVAKVHDQGMYVIGNFVFGFDYDTVETFDKTIDIVKSCEIDVPDIMILTPLPGTPLFKKLEQEGRILTYDWSIYNFEDVVFRPKNMSPEELFYHSRRVFKELYSTGNIISRMLRAMRFDLYKFIDIAVRNIYFSKRRYQEY